MRRTTLRRVEYYAVTVSGRTQPYAQGDVLPRLDNTKLAVSNPTGAAAAVTGNQSNPVYTTETMFDLRAAGALECSHFRYSKGIHSWKVEPLADGEAMRAAKSIESLLDSPKVDKLFWDLLFKDFPSMKKAFPEEVKKEFADYFRQIVSLADDDAAVASVAEPFLLKHWETTYINPTTMWRIVETLALAVELQMAANCKYEKRTTRQVLERVTKIGLNTLAKQPWMHEESTSPLFQEVGGFRAWHEAGFW